MRKIKIEPKTELKGSVGTIECLGGILALHPDHTKYDHQKKVALLSKQFKESEGQDYLELEETDYDWIMEKLKTANFQGLMAGNFILSMEAAERIDG